ncbi:iron-sulfur cluster repair di-iron protein [Geomonas sp. RF6]|uniref:iron-sulfur cluster repair di-iron protein n=1 Tax=Geomonas sp. RF6 TaxID=2897342 RepID=UPI001E42A3DF|nr:iron-sulfur cluster repair di-iron protein [Geomonas sp. RF6]UFS72530.1 iron-sulfur cluster repair di-iron protein [Geomonas sp. RF6]
MEKTASIDITKTTIGEVVAEDFRTAQVFQKYGIDFCCGGKITLAETCRERDINPDTLLQEISQTKAEQLDRSQDYGAWPLPFLADYIINTHHAYLNENLEQISAYAQKIATVHGERHPELGEIARIFERIATDMAAHLREEEDVLFPAVRRIAEARKAGKDAEQRDLEVIRESLSKLDKEHQEIGDAVHTIRHLASDYTIPADACNTFMVTFQKLKEFEDDLHKHVHLENNILFPKAAGL